MDNDKKILSPKIDVVFHMIFGEQEHEKITKGLIADIIGEKVETIKLNNNPYLWGKQAEDKLGIVDIRATINDRNPVDIEMQVINNQDIEKRVLFYWSKLYLKQLKRGEDYDSLNRCINIVFLDYELEKLKEMPIHTKWQILNTENGKTLLTEDLELHIIEVPKVYKKLKDKNIFNDPIIKWILFLEDPGGEEIREMAESDEEIKEAIETLEEISSDEEKERIAELREKYIRDRNAEMKTARNMGLKQGIEEGLKQGLEDGRKKGLEQGIKEGKKEGKKEGIKEGIKEGKEQGKKEKAIEIAKKMLKEKFPIETVIRVTGITKDEIEKNVL